MTSSYHRKFKSHPAARDTLAGSQYRWSVLDRPQDLIGLEPAWRVLGERAGGPVEQFDWVYACATLGDDYVEDLQVLALTREDELAAVVERYVGRPGGG